MMRPDRGCVYVVVSPRLVLCGVWCCEMRGTCGRVVRLNLLTVYVFAAVVFVVGVSHVVDFS